MYVFLRLLFVVKKNRQLCSPVNVFAFFKVRVSGLVFLVAARLFGPPRSWHHSSTMRTSTCFVEPTLKSLERYPDFGVENENRRRTTSLFRRRNRTRVPKNRVALTPSFDLHFSATQTGGEGSRDGDADAVWGKHMSERSVEDGG